MSSENSYITLNIKNQNTFHQTYQVITEKEFNEEQISLGHLHSKKNRITIALTKIESQKFSTQAISTPFYDYFSLKNSVNINQINKQANEKQLPTFCRPNPGPRSKSKKKSCGNWRKLCSFSIEMILNLTKSISHDDILEELEIHDHPTSRKFQDENGNKRNRSKWRLSAN